MLFAPNFKIENNGLRAVFNVLNPKKGEAQEVSLDEKGLLARIDLIEGGGRTPTLEMKALFELQRRRQAVAARH